MAKAHITDNTVRHELQFGEVHLTVGMAEADSDGTYDRLHGQWSKATR